MTKFISEVSKIMIFNKIYTFCDYNQFSVGMQHELRRELYIVPVETFLWVNLPF